MTTKQSDTAIMIYRGITTVAWAAILFIVSSANNQLRRIDEKMEVMKSVQDKDHTEFRVGIAINTGRLTVTEGRVRNLEIDQRRNTKQLDNLNDN
jgi:class 3 adenylate cyclase